MKIIIEDDIMYFSIGVFIGMLTIYLLYVLLKPCKCPGYEVRYIWWWL